MPFQSEKQRRYLWANEPEIARDWTDTYGSGIAKALGGRIPFQDGSFYDGPFEKQRDLETNALYYDEVNAPFHSNRYTQAWPEVDYSGARSMYTSEIGPEDILNYDPMLMQAYLNRGSNKNQGINQLPNDFNRNYQFEDANWRTRLRNKGSGIKRALMGGLGRVIDFPLGIMSAIAQGFPNNAQEQAMVDLYGGNTVTSGPMAGYNAASMFGKGLPYATQKRISKREETLQKMAHWEDWRKKRFQEKTAILKRELAKQQRALLDQANQVKTTYHRDEPARQGGQNPSAQSFRSAPGGLSQAQSRAARGDPQGTGGGWKW